MRELSQICTNIPVCPEEKMISAVMNAGDLEILENPKPAKEISCPMCQSKVGFYIPIDMAWSCLNWDCLKVNGALAKTNIEKCISKPVVDVETIGAPYILKDACFARSDQKNAVLDQIKMFVASKDPTLWLSGPSGTGKTFLSVCCLREFCDRGIYSRFYNCSELYTEFLNVKKTEGSEISLLNKLREYGVVVLDDMGIREPTESFKDFLYNILNYRITARDKKTIVTTNLNSKEFNKMFGTALLSRLTGGVMVKVDGKDRRIFKN